MTQRALAAIRHAAPVAGTLLDLFELTKPGIVALVSLTVFASGFAVAGGIPDWLALLGAVVGTMFIGASASAMNHFLEWKRDAVMDRTAGRPLAAGRLDGDAALAFAAMLVMTGLAVLTHFASITTALLALFSWLLYVVVYTPLKGETTWNTAIGAVAGAMPVLIGAAAVERLGDAFAWGLFAVLVLWQFPHFMAIAWLYRRQYRQAGMQMLTVTDPSGVAAGWLAVGTAVLLLPAYLTTINLLGGNHPLGVLIAGAVVSVASAGQAMLAAWFALERSERSARWLLKASLLHWPATLLFSALIPVWPA